MKRFLTIVSALCICAVMASGANAAIYGWTVSKSNVDPLVQTGDPNGTLDHLYLWFYCSDEGMASAEMDLVTNQPGQIIGTAVLNGYLNAGSTTHLLLAVGGCPNGPVVAADITIFHIAPMDLCLGGANVTVDCSVDPQAWPHDVKGYTDNGISPCVTDTDNLCVVSVEESSWGSIKSLYR